MGQVIEAELKLKYGNAIKEVDKLKKELQEVKESFEASDKAAEDSAKSSKGFGKALGAIGKAGGVIFLLEKAFGLFQETLGKNQTIIDATATATEFLSIAFNDLFSFIQNNVGAVTETFTKFFDDPLESINNLRVSIQEGIIKRVKQGIEALGLFGKAAVKFFQGDWAGASETAKEATKELFDVVTGEEGGFEAVKETITNTADAIKEYTKSTLESAKATVELNKQSELAEAIQQGLVEKYDLQAEQQRQIRDDESKTIEERIKANEKLGEILDKQEEEMMKNAQLRVDVAAIELAKNKDNLEAQKAFIEAENELAAVQAQVAGFRSEQLTNINSLERERLDLIKEANEDEFQLEMDRVKNKQMAVDAIAGLVNQETAIGKIAFIAKQGLVLKEMMLNAKKALQDIAIKSAESGVDVSKGFTATLKAGFPQNVPLIIAYAAQAAGIIASMTKAVGKAKSKIPGGGGNISSPSRPNAPGSQAPAFNIVGSSDSNQLADAIAGQSQQPVRAFVVSNDVTSAQELDRNIIEGASIG